MGHSAIRRFSEVTFAISPINARRHCRVTESKGCALEDVGYPRVDVRLVAGIGGQLLAKQIRQVLVHDYVLEGSDDSPSGPLKDVFVIPIRIVCLYLGRLKIVPAVKDDAQGQKGRILVGSRVS